MRMIMITACSCGIDLWNMISHANSKRNWHTVLNLRFVSDKSTGHIIHGVPCSIAKQLCTNHWCQKQLHRWTELSHVWEFVGHE